MCATSFFTMELRSWGREEREINTSITINFYNCITSKAHASDQTLLLFHVAGGTKCL